MSNNLETRHIYIDTSIFIEKNFQYKSDLFQKLVSLSKSDDVHVHLTTIAIEEVRDHISQEFNKSIKAIDSFKSKGRILRNIKNSIFSPIFLEVDKKAFLDHLLQQFDEFLEDTSVNIISVESVSVKAVFNKYFLSKPPFSEGKKKHEFPDAFALSALEQWCINKKERMYVISKDPDFEAAADESEYLIPLTRLEQFLNLIAFHDEAWIEIFEKLLKSNLSQVQQIIGKEFESAGFWLEDQRGEVENIRVRSIDIQDFYFIAIIDEGVDKYSAILEVTSNIDFTADVSYDDLDNATWDSETKMPMAFETINDTIEREIELTSELRVVFEKGEQDSWDIKSIEFKSLDSLDFPITIDNQWPYK